MKCKLQLSSSPALQYSRFASAIDLPHLASAESNSHKSDTGVPSLPLASRILTLPLRTPFYRSHFPRKPATATLHQPTKSRRHPATTLPHYKKLQCHPAVTLCHCKKLHSHKVITWCHSENPERHPTATLPHYKKLHRHPAITLPHSEKLRWSGGFLPPCAPEGHPTPHLTQRPPYFSGAPLRCRRYDTAPPNIHPFSN